MKKSFTLLTAAFLALAAGIAFSTEASAVVCASGPYRAGCAGRHGAVGVHRGYGYGYPRGGAVVVRRPYGGGAAVYRRY